MKNLTGGLIMNIIKKISWKNVIYFVIPLLLYILPSLFFKIDKEYYYSLNGPHLPPIVFIVVWSIIYILMSILISYYVDQFIQTKDKSLIKLFVFIGINYVFNIMYVPLFFMLKELFLSFVVCLVIFITICLIGLESMTKNKKASLLTVPYIIWSIIATVFSILFYLQN